MASVAVGLWIGTGGRHEPAQLNGISHFIEHMLFKGTRRRTARQISEAVEGLGGYLNAFTSEDHTCIYARAHHQKLDPLVDVLFDMLLESVFDLDEIRKEREVIKEELAMYNDQPAYYVQELLNATVWPDHPLGRSLTGTPASLDNIGQRELRIFHEAYYNGTNVVVAAAGRVDHTSFRDSIRRHSRGIRHGNRPRFAPAISLQRAPAVRLARRRVEQTQLALGIRTCSRQDPRRYAVRLLNALLGENMSSRLFQSVREERGLAYNISTAISFWADVGDLVVSAGVDPGKLEAALELIATELHRAASAPLPRGEFQRVRDCVMGQMELALENTESRMMSAGEQLLTCSRVDTPSTIKRHLGAVTRAELQGVARDFLRPERMNLAVVGPLRTAGHLARCLCATDS
jgi:predicted Zn-dependent peptidase